MKSEDLSKFIESFFKSIKCTTKWEGNILKIENIPEPFERFYGKKSPYYFVFSSEDNNEKTELITKGSSLIKTMSEFLKNKAQKSILKLDIEDNSKEELGKNLKLKNLEITNLSKNKEFDYIFRFTFVTTFHYKNKKEQITNHIYIHEGEIIENFRLDDYPTKPGDKNEVIIPDIKPFYELAKEKLKESIKPKTLEFSEDISQSLEIEMNRIKSHFVEQFHEIQKEIDRYAKRIPELEQETEKANPEKKIEIREKIERFKDNIEKIKEKNQVDRLEKERDMYLTDEKHKHSLNISNDLLNSAIVYYPKYKLSFFLKSLGLKNNISKTSNQKISRLINLEYNPLTKKISTILCDSCKSPIREIYVCNSGHINCHQCIKPCPSCLADTCQACEKIYCNVCKKDICKSCLTICAKCRKHTCESDICTDYISDEKICISCASLCPVCNKFTEKEFFKKCNKCKKLICPKCLTLDLKSGKMICKSC